MCFFREILSKFIIAIKKRSSNLSQNANWIKTAGVGTVVFEDATAASTTVIVTGGSATIQANFGKQLTLNIWTIGSISAGESKLFCLPATIGDQYEIKWDDSRFGSGTYTCDVKVSAYRKDLTTAYFTGVDSGYIYPEIITAEVDYFYIRVQGFSPDSAGNFAVKVSPPTCSLTVTNNGKGTTNPSGDVTVEHGVSTLISAIPNAGYQFLNWTKIAGAGTAVFGDPNSSNTTVTVFGGHATIRANFGKPLLQNVIAIGGGATHSLVLKK